MKEKEFISTIKNLLKSEYIGDDCAFLEDLGIVITQDSLVEDVHFRMDFCTPFQLGYKSVMVNLSDICASGAEPKYLTISLSLPDYTDNKFISEFYNGCKFACKEKVEIVGGDITGAEKIYISICAIGSAKSRNISSRKNAQIGHKVVVSGIHGSSGAGLKLLFDKKTTPQKFIKSHLEPEAQIEFGKHLGEEIKEKYSAMDTSDGLMDALSSIANESGVLLDIDFEKIPHDKELENYKDWKNLVLFGGEDYQIVATVPQNFNYGIEIGTVKKGLGVNLKSNNTEILFTKEEVENRIFNHFNNRPQ